jgi:methylmalonyl-CoA/ethylmalonyl-CoA epimerase
MKNLAQSRIRQIAVVCKDVARATAFYRDTLGLPFLFAAGPNLAFFDCGGVRLMLSSDNAGHDNLSSMLYYLVTDIEGTQRDLEGKGVAFVEKPHVIAKMPDHELWLSAFNDSEGNVLGLMEEKR